ncbi:MAG TPA: GerW family sporulation protein [Halanaerobiales bacterium]|nr:GerW family sporulation protein [Halanaerobiales bacterium]
MKETKEILESMYNKLDNFLKTETVIGEPIEFDNVKLIPIITASFGLGGGFGEESENGGGGGGGLGCKITPDAILVVKDDNVEMLPIKSKNSLEKLFEKVPEIMDKININAAKKDKSEKKEMEKED